MELFKSVSVDWLGKKWWFFATSWLVLAAGVVGYFVNGGFRWGIDFTGGTVIVLKFSQAPDLDRVRAALKPESVGSTVIQRYGAPADHAVIVRMQTVFSAGQDADTGQRQVQRLLRQAFDPQNADKTNDFNGVGQVALTDFLLSSDPDGLKAQGKTSQEIQAHYQEITRSALDYRDKTKGGLISSLDLLREAQGVSLGVVESLKKSYFVGPIAVKGVESVGAVVGEDLRRRALLAVGLSFVGMLIYVGFRFKPIYGVASIVALFHDVTVTLSLFALTGMEISLTVIAALLTLIGYSMNDTIVVFDRVRENLRLQRRDTLPVILNLSINQTLSRTIMTSGVTFLAVLSLFFFGGEVLRSFSFALVVGIIIGSYSTLGIASPVVDWWYRVSAQGGNGKKR